MKRLMTIAFVLAAAASHAATPIDEQIDAQGARTLEVNNIAGVVTVAGVSGDSVRVRGSLSDSAESLEVRRDGSRIVVRVVYPQNGNRRFGSDEGTILEIAVPADLELHVSTISAGIDVTEVRGEQRLESISGSIETTVFDSEIAAMTTSGRIEIRGSDNRSRAEVSSVSGSVELEALSGEVNAQTVSGSIELRSANLDRADLTAVSGSISVAAVLAANGRLRAVTTSGRISLDLDGSPAGEYEVTTVSGSIDNCFGPEPSRSRFGPPTATLRFDEPGAGTQVSATSMSGSIELCK